MARLADENQGAWALTHGLVGDRHQPRLWHTDIIMEGCSMTLAKDSCAHAAHLLRLTTTQEVHNHHDHEEKIFFPWMETKVKLPPKMSADHKTLIANLDDVGQGRAAARVPLGVVR